MKVLTFQPRFADMVARGEKCQTIRRARIVPILPTDTVSLRMWTGAPYRSKQRVLGSGMVFEVAPVVIDELHSKIDGERIRDRNRFAQRDGFRDWDELLVWFRETHGLPFHGTLIRWLLLTGGVK